MHLFRMPFIWNAVQRSPLNVFCVKHLCAEVGDASGEFQPLQTHLYVAFKQTWLHLSVFPLADSACDGHVPRHTVLAGDRISSCLRPQQFSGLISKKFCLFVLLTFFFSFFFFPLLSVWHSV